MLDQLFNSKTRVKILSLFESTENARYYLQQIVRMTNTDPASIHRELNTLEEIGFLESQMEGKQKYFSVRKDNQYWALISQLIATYKNQNQDRWVFLGYGKDTFPVVNESSMETAPNKTFFDLLGIKYQDLDYLAEYTLDGMAMWLKQSQLQPLIHQYKNIFLENPDKIINLNAELSPIFQQFLKLADSFAGSGFSKCTNQELIQKLIDFIQKHSFVDATHWQQTLLEFNSNEIDKKLNNSLKIFPDEAQVGIFGLLTTPLEDFLDLPYFTELINIITNINSKIKVKNYFRDNDLRVLKKYIWRESPEIYLQICKITNDFGYLAFGRRGPGWQNDLFIEIIKNLIDSDCDLGNIVSKAKKRIAGLLKKQSAYESQLDVKSKELFKAYRYCITQKNYRKQSTYLVFQYLPDLLDEIASRFGLESEDIRQMYSFELEKLLNNKVPDLQELSSRKSRHLAIRQNQSLKIMYQPEIDIYLKSLDVKIPDNTSIILYGKTIVPGRVRGVCATQKLSDTLPDNCILIVDFKLHDYDTSDLEKQIDKILGIVILDTIKNTGRIQAFTMQYAIPCVTEIEFNQSFKNGKLIDLDGTHAKVTIL